ncbi:hypothetical protein KAU33_00875, partial [Candidatus Dependentiae bacterium]|nr:hypothetical protein [Candidatus Dependentiae bacterium]
MRKELVNLKNYILSEESENATSHLVYPFFQKVFKKDKFKKESAASGADIYIEGRLVVELKTKEEDWVQGFYQALHYNKKGLSFSAICVISHNFIGLWRLEELPDFINDITANSDPNKSANEIGRINANKTNKGKQKEILKLSTFLFNKNQSLLYDIQLSEFEDLINNLDVLRTQINPDNFLRKIGILKTFIPDALEAIHCFYTMLPYWDVTSKVPNPRTSKQNTLWINGQNGSSVSDEFTIDPKCQNDFRKFVENHYIFTNDEEGISIDYYFSRFDEALAK